MDDGGYLMNLGAVAHAQGNDARAWALLQEGLALEQTLVATQATAEGLELLAAIAVGQGQAPRAAQLLGAAASMRAALGTPLLPVRRQAYEYTVATVREALEAQEYAAAWATGQVMTLEQAITLALSSTPTPEQ